MSLLSLILFSFLVLFPFYTSQAPISLPLIHRTPPLRSSNHSLSLADLAVSSLGRARRLKNPHNVPVTSHSYGGYSLPLSFGTPPQSFPIFLDTGSPLPWIPCTKSYLCRNCPSTPKTTFIPKMSSSSKLIGCLNPKCSWIHSHPACPKCDPSANPKSPNCSSAVCPPYFVLYGSGSTAGFLLSETLTLSTDPIAAFPDFAVGCSLVSDHQPPGGVAGFSRGPVSLPAQLNLTRFSYCLVSRRYDDDASVAGSLTLDGGRDGSTDGVRFAPLLRNPAAGDVFSDYYYVGLNQVTVGGRKVSIPGEFFVAGGDGNGGVIIDSGTTFTYMGPTGFGPLVEALTEQVKLRRDEAAEERTGLKPCFQLPAHGAEVSLPELAFHFKGGAEMRLPLENYFAAVGDLTAVVCLTVVSDGDDGVGTSGPSMILGNFQQQNYYVVYDLEREKLGFRRQKSCAGA